MRRASLLLLTFALGCEGGLVWTSEVGDSVQPDAGMGPDNQIELIDGGTTPGDPPPTDPPPMDPPPTSPPATPECESDFEAQVRALANGARADEGTGPLSCDIVMGEVARAHAQDMCDNGYFDHTSQDGRSPFDRMRAASVSYRTAGENIARGQRTPDSVHTGWMNSPGHRRNILNASFGRIGVGYVECGGRPLWVQVFAD